MKNALLFSSALFFSLMVVSVNSSAQCTADAGPDTTLCIDPHLDTTALGGSPPVEGGTPPYSYTWSARWTIDIFDSTFVYTASDILDDTTAANPSVINLVGADSHTFFLKVTDRFGQRCRDTVDVSFCGYTFTTEQKITGIDEGDTTQLYPGAFGDCPPIHYEWSPIENMSDPNVAEPYVWPDTTTHYTLTLTDSAGCQVTDGFSVYVNPLAVDDPAPNVDITIFPNPLTKRSSIQVEPFSDDLTWELYDIRGQMIKRIDLTGPRTEIERADYEAGMYFWRLSDGERVFAQGKLVVE